MRCCFTGHRDIPHEAERNLSVVLENTIRSLIADGAAVFYAGGAQGFDTIASKTVLKIKQESPDVRLILLLPCRSQTRFWSHDAISEYEHIKQQADAVRYVSETYSKACMFKRNRELVDNSDVCVSYLDRESGGTAYTVRYARSKGLRIINLAKK